MTEIKNIRGEFTIHLAGSDRTMKANFDAVERLENKALNGTIFEKLNDAMQGKAAFKDIVSVIHVGLICAKDPRLSREQIGNEVFENGIVNYMQPYIEFLTYCITGGKEAKGGDDEPGEA